MAIAPFFNRTFSAVGRHLGITRDELEKVLSSHIVGVHLAESCCDEGNEKWTASLLVNMLARLYPVLSLSGERAACEECSRLAQEINPNIEIRNELSSTVSVAFIGGAVTESHGFSVEASGWVAYVGKTVKYTKHGPHNPYSAGAAAAIAAWRIFQEVVMQVSANSIPDISVSLLDYSSDAGSKQKLPPVDLGEVAVAGLGAVGNPAFWAWARHRGLKGFIHLIDPEKIELSNLQRYCLSKISDIDRIKVQIAVQELEKTKIKVRAWQCTLEAFGNIFAGISSIPTICVSVDNVEGRRAAQALLPRLILNGWTSDSGLGVSWHRFSNGSACLGCLYHPLGKRLSLTEEASQILGIPVDDLWVKEKPLDPDSIHRIERHLNLPVGKLDEWTGRRIQDVYTDVVCGHVGIDLPVLNRVATTPLAHQSVLSGIFMAAELVKRSNPSLEKTSQPQPLVIWDNILRNPPQYWSVARAPNNDCFCSDPIYREVYKRKWDRTIATAVKGFFR